MPNRFLKTKLNEPSKEQLALPFYSLLPKSREGLLRWKIYARERALTDLEFRSFLRQACAADVAFFAATCVWLHETRNIPGQPLGKFPFHPDCDQVDLLAWIAKYGGQVDMTCAKTRGIGLTYLVCVVLLWIWLFKGEKLDMAVVTKDEDSLDLKDRPSSLMGKLDVMFAELPAWLRLSDDGKTILDRAVSDHRFRNKLNGNTAGGYVAKDDKLRSGRFYMIVLDEAAFFPSDVQRWATSAHGCSFSIIWISTFDGTSNMFYRISNDDSKAINIVRMETWWEDNPRWSAGKYISRNGLIEKLDSAYLHSEDYDFSHEFPGVPRSPMVDAAFNRPGADKQRVREELYGIAVKDSRKLFSNPQTIAAMQKHVKNCVWRGDLINDEWVADEEGPIQLWTAPENFSGVYSVGADPSLGTLTGARAGLSAVDTKTGLFMLSGIFQDLDAILFAQKAVAVCKKLAGPRGAGYARLIWESTGVNTAFSSEVARLRYPAVWNEPGKATPGCHNMDRGEGWLLELGRAITDGHGILVCRDCQAELAHFEYDRKFDLVFAGPEGHGDLAIAYSLAWRGARDKRRSIIEAAKSEQKKTGNEIRELNAKRRKAPWSARFDSGRVRQGKRWL